MNKELKPCPFCGEKAYTKVVSRGHIETAYTIGAEVGCKTCAFRMRADTIFEVDEFMNVKMVSEGIQHMIEHWNRRANEKKEREKAISEFATELSHVIPEDVCSGSEAMFYADGVEEKLKRGWDDEQH